MTAGIEQNFPLIFFLSDVLLVLGIIPLDRFPIFEAQDGSVFQHTSIGLLNMFYCEIDEFFGLLLNWALDKPERNESSDVTLC